MGKTEKIKVKLTQEWNLRPLFKDDDDSEMEKQRKITQEKNYKFINKWKGRDDYLKNSIALKEALDEVEDLLKNYGTGGDEEYYFWLRTSQDQDNPKLKAKMKKISDFSKKIGNDIQFFELRLAKTTPEDQKKFLADEGLKDYRHYLEILFKQAEYQLSEPEEKILNLKEETSHSSWVDMVSRFLSKEEGEVIFKEGKSIVKNFSEIIGLLDSQDKKVRDSASKAFNDIIEKHIDTAEVEINSILANKKIDDELRKMPRPDLDRHLSDDIESAVVDSLLDAVSSRFDISRKYYELKAKLMGVERLEYHERNVPFGRVDKKYSYDEVATLVDNVFQKLDKKFSDILKRFMENGQIDVFPKKGKTGGAFCIYNLLSQPTYILLNHMDKLNDVLTLAHEVGHGINDELIKEKQNALNFSTPTSTAEVASTFMEDFVLEKLLKEANDELKLAILMQKLNSDISTIFRQVACYRFEQELHQRFRDKGYLSKEDIGKIFQKHMSVYMGDFVEQSPGAENWWVYWSHIRRFFYVYSYASGLLISKSLQANVKSDPKFIDKVKEFLSAGRSDSPTNIFKRLGVEIEDKEFWNKGLNEVEALLQETEDLSKKLGKI